jgi:quinol monooxygenase YgiN
MLVVTGAVTARPETFEALREASLAHVSRSRQEPGCIAHGVSVDCEAPLRLIFYEEWADREALDRHFAQPGSAAFMQAVRELSAAMTPIRIHAVVERA